MSALPLGRYRQLLHQLLQLNEQAAALRRELTAFVDKGVESDSAVVDVAAAASPPGTDTEKINNNPLRESETGKNLNGDLTTETRTLPENQNNENRDESFDFATSECLQSSLGSKKRYYNSKSEDVKPADEDLDEENSNIPRKPHFLDDDYHLKSNDASQILKPHFLDQSLSPDDDKVGTLDNYDTIKSDVQIERLENFRFRDGNDEIVSRDKNELFSGAILSSHASGSHRYSNGFDNERDMWQSNQDSCSVKSFFSAGSENITKMENSQRHIGSKVDCVYSLLSLLSLSTDCNADMSEYLLEMSKTVDSCIAMRQSGCVPLLVQLIHSKHSRVSKDKAAAALHNMIHIQPDDKSGRREVRVLRLLEQVRDYCYLLEDIVIARKENNLEVKDEMGKHPVQSVAALMKLSFDEEHRHVMCQLGGLQSLASLVTADQAAHGSIIEDIQCITMRKYSGMALTNLTFGDGNNKALLCSFKDFMISLVEQLQSPNDDMRQVTAAVLRNLSWRADSASKQILRDVGAVKGLTVAAMTGHKEATLKSVLSALWNLTAHCSLNKAEICAVNGALAFLVKMLSFDAPSKTLAIIENAGGILRNVSSHIAIREDYRAILREHNCLKILLQQLKSPSLTVVSNSCGTLWNLSARCREDQQFLWDHGAVPMLRSLIHSKHKMIAMGSSAALKNLLNSTPGKNNIKTLDATARDLNLPLLPTLGVRKQKALEQELDQNLSETCENIEPNTSPTTSNRDEKLLLSAAEKHLALTIEKRKMSSSSPLMGHLASQITLSHSVNFGIQQNGIPKGHVFKAGRSSSVNRSDSRDSVTSTHSDSIFEINSRNGKLSPCSKNNLTKNNDDHSVSPKLELDFAKHRSRQTSLLKYDCLPLQKNSNRNNYAESGCDIENYICDQPIDYGQKYCETKSHNMNSSSPGSEFPDSFHTSKSTVTNYSRSSLFHIKNDISQTDTLSEDKSVVPYGDYQETDLDQPTDYSLRYAEDDSDPVSNISEPQIISVHEDTIKHFCTEGTPYETPVNFSTATSMSDLRAIGRLPVEQSKDPKPINVENKENANVMVQSDERDTCSMEDTSKHNNDQVFNDNEKALNPVKTNSTLFASKFSSGMASPEKPINYCEEGTPGYFSRVSSLSSLGEIGEEIHENGWNSEEPNTSNKQFLTSIDENLSNVTLDEKHDLKDPLETASNLLNYAEETPLMFSRCSSLDSLSECSIPDQADDVRSVVSEFSRLTSGCISPSELPDSPTQSPLPRMEGASHSTPPIRLIKYQKPLQATNRLHSVFEDEVSTFKFENTPIEFSTGTSLSSLTIDDDPAEFKNGKPLRNRIQPPIAEIRNLEQKFVNLKINHSEDTNDKVTSTKKAVDSDLNAAMDSCCTYYTEDTPAVLSKVGSQSDLSILSIPETEDNFASKNITKRELSDDSSNISGDSDNLLAECIQSGMPKHNTHAPVYILPRDEIENYAIEGSPFRHSAHSSLSDLTLESVNTDNKSISVKKSAIYTDNILEPGLSKQPLMPNNNFTKFQEATQQGSPTGSLSSVSMESDDGHLLDMAIRAGVPQKIGNLLTFEKGLMSMKIDLLDQVDSAHNNLDEKSEDNETVLARNDSLSSLSVDSLGSNEGEQALFEQCIKSGMPKVTTNKWEGVHAKTLDKNFKARLSQKNKSDMIDRHITERADESQDAVFENLVTAGAFATCSRKHSKTEENLSDKTLLEEAIYCGMPKRKPLNDDSVTECNYNKNLVQISKNVHATSVVAGSAIVAATDVKTTTEIKNVAEEKTSSSGDILKNLQSNSLVKSGSENLPNNNLQDSQEDLTIVDSVSDMCVTMKAESNDTWNENTCPVDVSFPTISDSPPALTTFKSDNPDEIASSLPDLLEESIILSETDNCPDLTNRLIDNQATDSVSLQFDCMMIGSNTNSSCIEREAARLALMIKNNVSDYSFCLTDNSMYALDNVNPPSRMGSLTSMSHSLNINEECRSDNSESEKHNMIKRSIHNSYRKKSLPYGIVMNKENGFNNLESIKPPSEMEDMGDMEYSMLSVASIVSEVADIPKHTNFTDNDVLNSDNLPWQHDNASPKRNDIGKNSLTPKQKRQLVKDRYKTYTIDADILLNTNSNKIHGLIVENDSSPECATIESIPTPDTILINNSIEAENSVGNEFKVKKSIKQKRMENSERFKTQTINTSSSSSTKLSLDSDGFGSGTLDSFHFQIIQDATKAFEFLQKQPVEDSSFVDLECETMSLISEDDSELNSLRMRALNKSFKNYLPVIESPTAVDKCVEENLKNISMKCEESDDRKDTPNISECEQNSETESADQNYNSETELPLEKPKPVISKPGESVKPGGSVIEENNTAKGVRGRRKGLYISPYKRTETTTKKSTMKSNTSIKTNKTNPPHKTSHNLLTDAKKAASTKSSFVTTSNRINQQKPNTETESSESNKMPSLVRQGTFVKEESVFPQHSVQVKATANPTKANKTPISKLPQLSSKIGSLTKTSSIESNISSGKSSVKLNLKSSNDKSSNQNPHNGESSKTAKSARPNSSITSSKTLIKDTASKVASLWKKVEQNKNIPKLSTKTWITKESDKNQVSPVQNGVVAKTKLIRSSTFECSPKQVSTIPIPLKQKSSITIRDSQLANCKYNSKVPIVKSSPRC